MPPSSKGDGGILPRPGRSLLSLHQLPVAPARCQNVVPVAPVPLSMHLGRHRSEYDHAPNVAIHPPPQPTLPSVRKSPRYSCRSASGDKTVFQRSVFHATVTTTISRSVSHAHAQAARSGFQVAVVLEHLHIPRKSPFKSPRFKSPFPPFPKGGMEKGDMGRIRDTVCTLSSLTPSIKGGWGISIWGWATISPHTHLVFPKFAPRRVRSDPSTTSSPLRSTAGFQLGSPGLLPKAGPRLPRSNPSTRPDPSRSPGRGGASPTSGASTGAVGVGAAGVATA